VLFSNRRVEQPLMQQLFNDVLEPNQSQGKAPVDDAQPHRVIQPEVFGNDFMRRCAFIALVFAPKAGPITIRRLLQRYTPEAVLDTPSDILNDNDPDMDARDRSFLSSLMHIKADTLRAFAEDQMQLAEQHHVKILTYEDTEYPTNLKGVPAAPPVLFVRGTLQDRDQVSVAIVGSRNASPQGCSRAAKLASQLTEHQIIVVSGLARGIDTASHKATIDAGGRTIAIVGCGLDRTYPSENADLAAAIAEQGAVVSQFPLKAPPAAAHFPMRNKTMALFSLATVVVEAGPQSGAKMQADFALKTTLPARHVFLLKSLIAAQGEHDWAHEFLKRGAQPMADIDDLLKVLPLPTAEVAGQLHLPL